MPMGATPGDYRRVQRRRRSGPPPVPPVPPRIAPGSPAAPQRSAPARAAPAGAAPRPSKPAYLKPLVTSKAKEVFAGAGMQAHTAKEDRKLERENDAYQFKQEETAKILARNVKLDAKGQPITKKAEVPVRRVSQAVADKALSRFKDNMRKVKRNVSPRRAASIRAQGMSRLSHDIYKFRGGKPVTKTQRVPVFEKPKAAQRELARVDANADRIARGNTTAKFAGARATSSGATEPDEIMVQRRFEAKGRPIPRKFTPEAAQSSIMGITPGSGFNQKILDETGLSTAFEYLTRPGVATETAVAKFLAGEDAGPIPGPHLLKGPEARKIRKAPGPGYAFTHGRADPKVITGGDVTEAAFGPSARKFGIVADLATDPLMYVGGGALLTRLPKLRSVARSEALIESKLPGALKRPRYLGLAEEARRTGQFGRLDEYLKAVKKGHGLRGVARPKRVKAREAAHRNYRNAQIQAAAQARVANAPMIGKQKVLLPGSDAPMVVAAAARSGELTRSVRPGFRLAIGNPLNPLSRPIASLKVPLPGKTPIPALTRVSRAKAGGPFQTLDDLTQQISRTRTVREAQRISNAMARNMDQHMNELVKEATAPITSKVGRRNEDAFNRVGLYSHVRAALGSDQAAAQVLGPLNKAEATTLERLDTLYAAQARQGKELGTLHASIPFYTPRIWQRGTTDFGGTVDPRNPLQTQPAWGVSHGTKGFYARHRVADSFTELASPDLLTDAIAKLSRNPGVRARASEVAEDLFQQSSSRLQSEILAREVQRGKTIHMDDLGPAEQRVVLNSSRDPDTALFLDPEATEGVLKLAPSAAKHHNFSDTPFEGLTDPQAAAARVYSAKQDRLKLTHALGRLSPDDPLAASYQLRATQLDEEIAGLKAARTPAGQFRAKLPDNPPEQYGVGTTDPLDYTGRLKDVRKDDYFPVLDPTVNAFYRSRTEAVNAGLTARWRGIDETLGTSIDDARNAGWTTNRDESIWRDPDGRAYVSPLRDPDDAIGQSIHQAVRRDNLLWPEDVLQDVRLEALRMGESAYKQMFYTGMESMFGRVMSQLRFGVTVPFIAYHIRNMISDVLKSVQAGGTGLAFHPIATGKLVSLAVRRGKKGTVKLPGMKEPLRIGRDRIKVPGFDKPMKYEEFLYITDLFGVRSGQHLSEYLMLAQSGKRRTRGDRAKTVASLGLGPAGPIGKRMIEFGARREDITRFLTFSQRMRANKGDVAEAAWYMTKHHFDYADLTASEKMIVRNLFLFYTWYRKNIPLQFAEMISRPGFFSGVANTYYSLPRGETPINQDWSQIHPMLPDMSGPMPMKGVVPEYMLNPLSAIQTNWNGHAAAFAFAAPWADLNLVQNLLSGSNTEDGLKQLGSMLNPAFSLMLALGYQTDPLTGRRYKDYEATPGIVAKVAAAMGITTEPLKKGGTGIPFRIQSVLRSLPIFGRSQGYGLPATGVRDTGFLGKHPGVASFFGLTSYVSPSKARLQSEWYEMLRAKLGERTQQQFDLSNIQDSSEKKKLDQLDDELLVWSKEKGIPKSFLEENAQGTRFYVSKADKGSPIQIPGLGGTAGEMQGGGSATNPLGLGPSTGHLGLGSGTSMGTSYGFGGGSGAPQKRSPASSGPFSPVVSSSPGKTPPADTQRGRGSEGSVGKKKLDSRLVSISGPALEPAQAQFASHLAKDTGLSAKVVGAWVAQEGGHGGSDHNWLNIGWTDSGPIGITGSNAFASPESAAKATGDFMRGKWGGASEGIRGIIPAARGRSDQEQIAAITNSGWATDPAYTENVTRNYNQITTSGKLKTQKYPGPYDGSQKVLHKIKKRSRGVPAPSARKEEGHSPTGDHDPSQPNAFANDLPATGAAGERLARRLAKDAGITDYSTGNFNDWTSEKYPGYRFQILWNVEDHYDHVHFGVRYEGADASATVAPGSGTATSYGVAPAGGAPAGPATPPGVPETAGKTTDRLGRPKPAVKLTKPMKFEWDMDAERAAEQAQADYGLSSPAASSTYQLADVPAADLVEALKRKLEADESAYLAA